MEPICRAGWPPETKIPGSPPEYGEIVTDEPLGGWEGVVPGEAIYEKGPE